MIHRGILAMVFIISIAPAASLAQSAVDESDTSAAFGEALTGESDTSAAFGEAPVGEKETPASCGPALADSSAALSIGSLALPRAPRHYGIGTSLIFSMDPTKNTERLSGFERYRASRFECTFQGAGMGATVGMAAGAFGMMAGAWDERSSWYIVGAAAALGALYGGAIKADDPEWNIRIRWEPDR